jgi:signal transduction histidine kinase
MARQVAHEIKNPLTPIQLNAEHLRRVHADRGKPLSPVLEECVATILTQVKLLRQIASEFSSFASSPAVRPSSVPVPELVHEAVDPYEVGLRGRIEFHVDVPARSPLWPARSTPWSRFVFRTRVRGWTPKHSTARSNRTSRPSRPVLASDCRLRSGTSSSTVDRLP